MDFDECLKSNLIIATLRFIALCTDFSWNTGIFFLLEALWTFTLLATALAQTEEFARLSWANIFVAKGNEKGMFAFFVNWARVRWLDTCAIQREV